jgi:hypothetical protein
MGSTSSEGERQHDYGTAQYTFVQCVAGADSELDAAGEWITKYAEKFFGRIITNFDELRPILANAPLSYQKLVAKTYEKAVFNHYCGDIKSVSGSPRAHHPWRRPRTNTPSKRNGSEHC